MVDITQIRYRDIARDEEIQRERLRARLGQLEKIKENRKTLSTDEARDMERITDVLAVIKNDNSELCAPLFVGVRDLFNAKPGLLEGFLGNHVNGVLQGSRVGHNDLSDASSCNAALTIGLLMVDGAASVAPYVIKKSGTATNDNARGKKAAAAAAASHNPIGPEPRLLVAYTGTGGSALASLSKMFFTAVGDAQSMSPLAMLVLPLLAQEGDPRRGDGVPGTVDAAEFARVMRALVNNGVTADEPQLRRRINEALNVIQNRNTDGSGTELGIDLPDLEDAAEASIVGENVQATGVFLCGAMFEELKVFEVVDKLVELFQNGMLTRTGNAGKLLYKYWKDTPNRMSDAERRKFYAMTMGIPGGEPTGMVNREFNDLWLRFASSVSSFVRQNEVEKLLRAPVPAATSHQQVRKAARDLAVNLSLHGYGMTYHAALDLQQQIKFMISLLGDPDIMANYGARDMWQVVDQVATLELGGAKTSSRYRVLATCGAIITAWLATNIDRIKHSHRPIIDMDEVRNPTPRSNGSKATTTPSDWDLVNACELWLADTGTADTTVDKMSQPRETPVMTSRPVQIPAIAREMLADLPGLGLGHSKH